MSDPSKNALANLERDFFCSFTCDREGAAAIIDRHFAPLRAKLASLEMVERERDEWKRSDNIHTANLHELGDLLAGRPNNGYLQMDLVALAKGLRAKLAASESIREELAGLLEQMLNVAECADETGYVTDVGFVDLDALHGKVRNLIARHRAGEKGKV